MPLPVVVLCGGLGTRLRAVVADLPKALAPVAGAPFLAHLLGRLRDEGVREIVLATGYLGEQVDAFAEGWAAERPDARVQCVREEAPLGTGGAFAFAAAAAGLDGPFVGLNGDTFFGGALGVLERAHGAVGATATLALARVLQADRYGRVLFEEPSEGALVRVTGFEEKREGVGAAWISAGAYVLTPEALAGHASGTAFSLEHDVFPALAARGALWACRFPDTPFLDIGTPEDYARAEALFGGPHAESGNAKNARGEQGGA